MNKKRMSKISLTGKASRRWHPVSQDLKPCCTKSWEMERDCKALRVKGRQGGWVEKKEE